MRIGFDNEKYLKMQSEHILERIKKFDNKLYLEFGGKLFDDYHASRVLPGFMPDSKLRMLLELKDQAEIVFVISAEDIENNKIRGDLGITYDLDVLRLIDAFRGIGLFVGSVCITKYAGQTAADLFQKRLTELGIRSYHHYKIPGYPVILKRLSVMRDMVKTNISKQRDLLLSLRPPVPEAVRWLPVFPSFIMSIKEGLKPVMQNLRLSRYGICR